jgi:hypothetical protein
VRPPACAQALYGAIFQQARFAAGIGLRHFA